MHAPSKILVPIDFSDSSRAALEYAATLGARFGAEVDVLHVWEPPREPGSGDDLLSRFAHSDEGRKMVDWLSSFELRSYVEPHGRLATGVRGDVPDAIVTAVASGSYDLVVMATHGRYGLSLLLRSSVTEQVVRRAPCPVITLRSAEEGAPPAPEDRDDPSAMNPWTWLS